MGAIQQNQSIAYLSIRDGLIYQRVEKPTATSKTRETKTGKTVHEECYKAWSGIITSVRTKETEFGKEWVVTIKDQAETAQLSFKYSSGYAQSFLKSLPNVELSKEVTITPKSDEVNGKIKTTIFINQGGKAVKWAYTKDNPNGCPGMEQIKIKGVTTWDSTKMIEFLESKVAELFDETPF